MVSGRQELSWDCTWCNNHGFGTVEGDQTRESDDLEERFDDILELLDDLPGDATLALAGDLGEDLLAERFSEILESLFFRPLAQAVQPSPSRLFNTGRYPILFARRCIYSPSFDFCLCSGIYFILRSVSLWFLNFPATLVSMSCCF